MSLLADKSIFKLLAWRSDNLTSSLRHPKLGDAMMQNIVYQQFIKYVFFE